MINWLKRRALNARIAMCTKELQWKLQAKTPVERACIAAIAIRLLDPALRESLENSSSLTFSSVVAERLYDRFEDIRNNGRESMRVTNENLRRALGHGLPDYAVKHAIACGEAVELWMVTFGAIIRPGGRAGARACWGLVAEGHPVMREAIALVHEVVRRTGEETGEQPVDEAEMFAELPDETWADAATYVPSFLS